MKARNSRQRWQTQKSLATLVTRRKVLGFIGGTAAVSLFGCWRGQSALSEPTSSSTSTSKPTVSPCIVKPELTEGPYFVDEKLNRSDIRSNSSDSSMRAGVPLQLIFQVLRLQGSACEPLRGAIVDVWHCDAQGVYSDVRDRSFDTIGQKFLRGYQVTDANGIAEFTTIYPGWYPGRTVHIHFKIRLEGASASSYEFTSQLFFDEALSDRVYAQLTYQKPGQRTLNQEDGIFIGGGEQLMPEIAQTAEGYSGKFAIALQLT
ncbi:intradiol ring-cleavage dioxygenase [Oscillatoria sp. FACHB-1406]|uniref:intradiol ring-cleavage dioxygenase n=1 Tax=Oscillatoria sp. FACHB-1406 TaxID=2692846 RepID=UPI001687477C|nr:intradiol ring-cleavage dioxygenase [Oscillatoria sp. FACHB-1406]MBD2579586.1 intradiol ring-cleavage dioxygenase [Oscillatoria sp. FACHB-1406]